jgi:hypothetical protein
MTYPTCTTALALLVAPALILASSAQAVDVWFVGVDNTRQGWNKFERVFDGREPA